MNLPPSRFLKLLGKRIKRPESSYPDGFVMTLEEARVEQRGGDWIVIAYLNHV